MNNNQKTYLRSFGSICGDRRFVFELLNQKSSSKKSLLVRLVEKRGVVSNFFDSDLRLLLNINR